MIARLRPTALASRAPGGSVRPAAQAPGASAVARSAGSTAGGSRAVRDQLVLASGGPDLDRRERHPDLAERLDRHEEAGEQEHDAEELAGLEELRRAEPGSGSPSRSG